MKTTFFMASIALSVFVCGCDLTGSGSGGSGDVATRANYARITSIDPASSIAVMSDG